MQIKSGVSRIVLLFPSLGIAIKIARIRVFGSIDFLWHFKNDRGMLRWFFTASSDKSMGFRWSMAYGIQQNLAERRFYRDTKNPFAWPTYFSLWGLVNIQPIGLPSKTEFWKLHEGVREILGKDRWDPHTFENPENFCRDKDGKLYLLDYGSEESRFVLAKYGTQLQEQL